MEGPHERAVVSSWLSRGLMDDTAIPGGLDRVAVVNPASEGTREIAGRSDCVEPPCRIVEGDFVAVVGSTRLENGEPKWRPGIDQVTEAGVPAPEARGAICRKIGDQAVKGSLVPGEAGSEHESVAVAGQPWVNGEQESAPEGEDEQGAKDPQVWSLAGSDRPLQAGSCQAQPQEDVGWPDHKGGEAPAAQDRSESQDEDGAQGQPQADE